MRQMQMGLHQTKTVVLPHRQDDDWSCHLMKVFFTTFQTLSTLVKHVHLTSTLFVPNHLGDKNSATAPGIQREEHRRVVFDRSYVFSLKRKETGNKLFAFMKHIPWPSITP